MRNTSKKIIFLLLMFFLIFMSLKTEVVYAKTDAEELKELLDEYEEDLGDLNQLKKVVDETYNDLYTATKVDDALKEKLNADIDKFDDIDGINPLIKAVLEIELKSQVSNLTDENIDEMREEISVIKEWVDAKVVDNGNAGNNGNNGSNENNGNNNINKNEQTDKKPATVDNSLSSQGLPKAGIKGIIGLLLIIIATGAIISLIRYIQLKEIK